jgi:aminoglycoside 3-N-acetyltransferase
MSTAPPAPRVHPPAAAPGPLVTRESLAADLRALGLRRGDVVLVHTAMSRLGWVCGGAVRWCRRCSTSWATPGHSWCRRRPGTNTDPATWRARRCRSRGGSRSASTPRRTTRRHRHPRHGPRARDGAHLAGSAAQRAPHHLVRGARAARAADIVAVHDLGSQCGERSPVAALERSMPASSCSEPPTGRPPPSTSPSTAWPTRRSHARQCRPDPAGRGGSSGRDVDLDDADFAALGAALRGGGAGPRSASGAVGAAECRLLHVRGCGHFATRWLREHRRRGGS